MWDLAADTWKKYLTRETSGGWADEARARLAAAEKKLEWHKQGQLILEDPAKFIAGIGSPAVKQNAEEYVNIALTSWLPAAQSTPPLNDFFFGEQKVS
jgi:hypothetical protein